jgi:hypothetical protein
MKGPCPEESSMTTIKGSVYRVSGRCVTIAPEGEPFVNVWLDREADVSLVGQSVVCTGYLRVKAGEKAGVIFTSLGGRFRGGPGAVLEMA